MAKYLRDLQIWIPPKTEEARKWGMTTNFLERLYLNLLPKFETDGVAKVVLTPSNDISKNQLTVMVNPDVLQLLKAFSFKEYWQADKEARKKMALAFLKDGLLEIASLKGWDTEAIYEAHKTILDKNLVNEMPWGKAVSGPSGHLKVQAWCNYDSDRADIFLYVFRSGKIISKSLATTVKPADIWINEAVGSLKWSSANKVELRSKDGREIWEISVPHESRQN
jgi:hypothetical protein